MQTVPGRQRDIHPDFLLKIKQAWPAEQAIYEPGADADALKYHAGAQALIKWIERHANTSSF